MDELELYKELYYFELTCKESIDARFTNPFSVYVILLGGMGYLINLARPLQNETKSGIIIMLFIFYGISLVHTGYRLYRAYHGHVYKCIANPMLLIQYKTQMQNYYDTSFDEFFSQEAESKEQLIQKDFKEYLLERYADAATHNQNVNHYKCYLFLKVGNCLVISAVLWVIVFIVIIF